MVAHSMKLTASEHAEHTEKTKNLPKNEETYSCSRDGKVSQRCFLEYPCNHSILYNHDV